MQWRPFPLHPEIPEEGVTLEELFRTDPARIDRIMRQLKETADHLGLPLGERHRSFNSRLAQELGLWAEEMGYGQAFHGAAFAAYFARGENLAKVSVLLEIAEQCGLPLDQAAEVLENRSYRKQVDSHWQAARDQKIIAVPTFILAATTLVGAQSYSTLQGLMLQHGIVRR